MARPSKATEAANEKVGNKEPIPSTEIGDPGPVEKVAETQFTKSQAEAEMFANEILTVIVQQDGSDNAVENPCATVNGTSQYFIRGQEQKIKRKYVEALARGRVTKYEQKTPDPTRPENIQMVERNTLVYPFVVVHDPNPKGREWLNSILAQPM